MDQSEFEANACDRLQARENACDLIGFSLVSHWLKSGASFVKRAVKETQSNYQITFDTHLKTALNNNLDNYADNGNVFFC